MPWSGGTYTRTNGQFTGSTVWTSDYNANIKILSSRHDTHDQDLAQGINACLNKSGQNTPTSDISWGGFKITNLAQGSASSDSARVGQTITGASLNTSTKILTLLRNDGPILVDMTPIVMAGDTADFVRLSADDQVFSGTPITFNTVQISVGNGLRFNGSGPILQWDFVRENNAFYVMRNGAELIRIPNSGSDMFIASNMVWHEGNFDPNGLLATSSNATITGSWAFTAGLQLPPTVVYASGAGTSWYGYNSGSSYFISSGAPGGLGFSIALSPTESAGVAGYIGPDKIWNQGNLRVSVSGTPSGGLNGDLWVITTGANKGLWAKLGGVWGKVV